MLKPKLTRFKRLTKSLFTYKVLFLRVLLLISLFLIIRCYFFARKQKLIIVGLYEHIGDIISCEPVVPFLIERDKNTKIVWIVNDIYKELINFHPLVFKVIGIKYFSEWVIFRKFLLKWLPEQMIVDLHLSFKECAKFRLKSKKDDHGIQLSDYLTGRSQLQAFSEAAGLPPLNNQPNFYCDHRLSSIEIECPYVVFHTSSNFFIKDWTPDKWHQLFYQIQKIGFKVVEIGLSKKISVQSPDYIDYTGTKSLQKIASIIKCARFFVGVDSGFAHMANALEKDGIVLIGEYHNSGYIHRHYNPFSGKYRNAKHIVFADFGSLACCIPVEKVVTAFKNLLEDEIKNSKMPKSYCTVS